MQPSRQTSDWAVVYALIDDSYITTLLCSDQESKLLLLSRVVGRVSDQEGVAIYIDLDTAFTALLERCEAFHGAEDLLVIRPEGGFIDEAIAYICSLNIPSVKLIVFDSTTTFYSLRGGGEDASSLNMKLGLYLALLRKAALKSGGRLIFTSMRRSSRGGGIWHTSYPGGRLLKRRSDLMLELSMDEGFLTVSVVKCRGGITQGRRLILQP